MMKWLLTAIAALALLPGVATADSAMDESNLPECCRHKVAVAPDLIAIEFRSDASESSRRLAPAIQALRDEATSTVLWATLDFSTSETSRQSEYLAKAMGLDDVWGGFARQTGFVLVVDGRTKKTLRKITVQQPSADMRRDLTDALAIATSVRALAKADPK